MRVIRLRRHLNASECRAIIGAAATLATMFNIRWRVGDNAPGQSLAALTDGISAARRDGSTFLIPEEARGWFHLSFDIPDAGYALALIFVWSFTAAGAPWAGGANGNHRSVAMWHLRHLLPRSAHRALTDIEYALARYDPTGPLGCRDRLSGLTAGPEAAV